MRADDGGSAVSGGNRNSGAEAGGIVHECAGGLVLRRRESGGVEALLIRVVRNEGESAERTEWLLPKGHIDPGELEIDAAAREVCEETGIPRNALLHVGPIGDIRYRFASEEGGENFKTVHFHLFMLAPDAPEPDSSRAAESEGIVEVIFAPPKVAVDLLTYDGYREVLKTGLELAARTGTSGL